MNTPENRTAQGIYQTNSIIQNREQPYTRTFKRRFFRESG